MITLRTFIDGLADELGVSAEARKKWWQRPTGVPLRWRRSLIDKAEQRGVTVDWDDLDKGPAFDSLIKVQSVPANARGKMSRAPCVIRSA